MSKLIRLRLSISVESARFRTRLAEHFIAVRVVSAQYDFAATVHRNTHFRTDRERQLRSERSCRFNAVHGFTEQAVRSRGELSGLAAVLDRTIDVHTAAQRVIGSKFPTDFIEVFGCTEETGADVCNDIFFIVGDAQTA
jgi:hypothetical protein